MTLALQSPLLLSEDPPNGPFPALSPDIVWNMSNASQPLSLRIENFLRAHLTWTISILVMLMVLTLTLILGAVSASRQRDRVAQIEASFDCLANRRAIAALYAGESADGPASQQVLEDFLAGNLDC